MIAQEVGIDVSTLHYHWGDKKGLYEAVVLDINKDLGQSPGRGKDDHGKPLGERLAISIDVMTDYCSNTGKSPTSSFIAISAVPGKRRAGNPGSRIHSRHGPFHESDPEPEGADSEGSAGSPGGRKRDLQLRVRRGVFRSIVHVDREVYITQVKEVLKFILIPAFVQRGTRAIRAGVMFQSAKSCSPFFQSAFQSVPVCLQ